LSSHVQGLAAPAPSPAPDEAVLARGAEVYAANCAQCHGDDGGGDGFAATSLPVVPTDFRQQRPALDAALDALRTGIEGTSMAPWSDRLGDADRLAVAHHVRRFYEGAGPDGGGRP
jgi:mono/diheme cytochrome c family protein